MTDGNRQAERAPWGAFPPVVRNGDLGSMKGEPEYRDAKAGDSEAAMQMVVRLVTPELVDAVRLQAGDSDAVLVPVLAQEASGNNRIPLMMAVYLGRRLGLDVTTDIVQSVRAHRTDSGADHRLAFSPAFDGPVADGQRYIILDDTLAMGGTLAALRGFIENRGGKVIGAAVMTAHEGALKLTPTPKMLAGIEAKHGSAMNDYWLKEFGYGIEQLTQGECGHLKAAVSVDAIRSRIAAARHAAGQGSRGTDAGPAGREEGQGLSQGAGSEQRVRTDSHRAQLEKALARIEERPSTSPLPGLR